MSKTMTAEAAAVIPARYGSTRFPGKVLADLGGKPVLRWVYDNCLSSGVFSRVVVAADREEVRRAAEDFGAEVVMTNPEHRTGTERVAEAAAGLEQELIVNVQGDEPFVDAGVLRPLVDVFQRGEVQVATLVTPIRELRDLTDPGIVKVVVGHGGEAVYFSRWPIPFNRRQWLGGDPWQAAATASFSPGPWWKHLGIYAFRRERLLEMIDLPPPPEEALEELEQLRLLHFGIPVRCLPVEGDFIGIDTPEDLQRARSLIGPFRKQGG